MNIRETLVTLGCVLEGEFFFALKSGRVATQYINIDPLLTMPRTLDTIASDMVCQKTLSSAITPQVIAGPAIGAIPLVYAVAREYERINDDGSFGWNALRTVFAEKSGDAFILERLGFEKTVRGKHVWVVEDIATTGGSAKGTAEAIAKAGGHVIGFSFIWNRGGVTQQDMGAPVQSLIDESVESWLPGEHPSWGKWPLVSDIGHPNTFSDYPGPRITLL